MTAYTAPPPDTVVVCLDELGPVSATTYPGHVLLPPPPPGQRGPRAPQENDWGRRGSGFLFGAVVPATGAAFTAPFDRRTGANWVTFLNQVAAWLPTVTAATHVIAILDNCSSHKTQDSAFFRLSHPTWTFCFQPTRAAWLNLIEPWWRIVRSLALAGRCFAAWNDLVTAFAAATAYWNAHRHPFTWGRRGRRPRPRRWPGVGHAPIFLPEPLPG